MKIRIIYSDLSEWIGDTKDFNKSPETGTCEKCKGILAITIFFNPPYKLVLRGNDHYGIRDKPKKLELFVWSGYKNGQGWIIEKETYKQKDWEFKKEDYPKNIVVRLGKWASDKNMNIANKRANQWV